MCSGISHLVGQGRVQLDQPSLGIQAYHCCKSRNVRSLKSLRFSSLEDFCTRKCSRFLRSKMSTLLPPFSLPTWVSTESGKAAL